MNDTQIHNTKVIANANALVSKTLERMEALVNKKSEDRSLDSPESEQSLQEIQQMGHLMMAEHIGKIEQTNKGN